MKSLSVGICACFLSLPAMAQPAVVAVGDSSSDIAKALAEKMNDPGQLRKTIIDFVNTSKAPLMCKISVYGMWQQIMKAKADYEQLKASPKSQEEVTQWLNIHFADVDYYCK